MKIRSNYYNRSFLPYQLLEHFLVSVLLIIATPLALFFLSMNRRSESAAEWFFESPIEVFGSGFLLAIVVNVTLLIIRSKRYIVQVDHDEAKRLIKFDIRSQWRSAIDRVEIPVDELLMIPWISLDLKILPSHVGYEFMANGKTVGFVVTDHFSWEDQNRKLKKFIIYLKRTLDRKTISP